MKKIKDMEMAFLVDGYKTHVNISEFDGRILLSFEGPSLVLDLNQALLFCGRIKEMISHIDGRKEEEDENRQIGHG